MFNSLEKSFYGMEKEITINYNVLEKKGLEFLKEVTEILDGHNIVHWLDMGTMLGAVREGRFIPGDMDIDLGTFYENISEESEVLRELRDWGFNVKFYGHLEKIKVRKRNWKFWIWNIDIYLYHFNEGRATRAWYLPKKTLIRSCIRKFVTVLRELSHATIDKEKQIRSSYHRGACTIYRLRERITNGTHTKSNNLRGMRFVLKHSSKGALMKSYFLEMLFIILNVLPHSLIKQFLKFNSFVQNFMRDIVYIPVPISVPSQFFTNLTSIKLCGEDFKVPEEKEKYACYRYGKDWIAPNKTPWIFYKHDGAIIKKQ